MFLHYYNIPILFTMKQKINYSVAYYLESQNNNEQKIFAKVIMLPISSKG